eukprot:4711850-Pleurochrysis_carterae.AAC.1
MSGSTVVTSFWRCSIVGGAASSEESCVRMESSSAVTGASDSAMCASDEGGATGLDRPAFAW